MDLYIRFGKKQLDASHPRIVELSEILRSAPIHAGKPRGENFRNPNGVSMKLANFLRVDPSYTGKGLGRGNQAEESIWAEFADQPYRLHREARRLRRAWREYRSKPSAPGGNGEEQENGEMEGQLRLYQHYARERNRRLVEKKKAQVLELTGCLACEVCGFDFAQAYGRRGHKFAECHHVMPLGELLEARRTKLSDLAIVCSNCHRIIHKRPMLSVAELRHLVERTKLDGATLADMSE